MTTKHVPEPSDRPSGTRSWKPTFVIATEGEKTEPDYFAHLNRTYDDINIILCPADDGRSEPRQVLDKLLCKKQELSNTQSNTYHYWIAIDHDDRPRSYLAEVMQDAESNDISVADSNPCFEAWLIQHFSPIADIVELSHLNQVKGCGYVINNHLKRPEYDPHYKKGRLDRDTYIPKVKSAIENAEFDEIAATDYDDFGCTGSRVHLLVKKILPDL